MVTAASDKRMRRRGGRRRRAGSTPAALGRALRDAREAASVSLTELNDRTGVSLAQLEALEAGDLSRFPDRRSALTAVRRYSDLVDLDVEPFAGVVEEHWGTAAAGFNEVEALSTGGANGGNTQSVYVTTAAATGHLSRYPGDGTHLRAFTQTDEVPGVRRAHPPAGNGHGLEPGFSDTGSFPAMPAGLPVVRQAPLLLRGLVWLTAAVLVVALGGLAVQHYQPKLLADLHLVHHPHTFAPSAPGASGPGATTTTQPARPSTVSLTDTSTGSATVSVRASNYTVVVAAWAPCWTVVHSPASFAPVFAATLPGGEVKEFEPADGQLTVSMSAALVTVQVKIGTKTVPGFLFKPTSVPFTLNFASTGTA